ncbi:MAG: hypothetical protein DDT24_00239 [Chloroflexi bacterium]|nr:hypothetical protein [Chloroflexota bacterium]
MVFLGYHFLSFPITGGVGISAHTFGIFHPPSVRHIPNRDLGCTARRVIYLSLVIIYQILAAKSTTCTGGDISLLNPFNQFTGPRLAYGSFQRCLPRLPHVQQRFQSPIFKRLQKSALLAK